MKRQAKTGGETGANGEFYKGGQFIAENENTVKGATIPKGTKKSVAPYVWAESPADDMLSIYVRIEHKCLDNRKECEFVKGQGFVGLKLTICRELFQLPRCNAEGTAMYTPEVDEEYFAWTSALVDRYNAGERWFPMSKDPYYFKNQVKK
jgi:hypothetical protein